jgi:hypothetical protein
MIVNSTSHALLRTSGGREVGGQHEAAAGAHDAETEKTGHEAAELQVARRTSRITCHASHVTCITKLLHQRQHNLRPLIHRPLGGGGARCSACFKSHLAGELGVVWGRFEG